VYVLMNQAVYDAEFVGVASDVVPTTSRPGIAAVGKKLGVVGLCVWLSAGSASAQPDHAGQYAQTDIQYGLTLYSAQCVSCHGPNGDAVTGINFRARTYRRVAADEDIRALVTNGIPGTGMPAFQFAPGEMTGIIAYLRNMDAVDTGVVKIGDANRGAALFVSARGRCLTCHRVNGTGSRLGPNLSAIGSARPASHLEQALMFPTDTMLPVNRSIRAITRDGRTITGRRINEDTYTVQIIDSAEQLRSLIKADLREYTVLKTSNMPSYLETFNAMEMADMVAYLLSLKGTK
jgi:putative heme-binding domain-containing protein